MPLLCVAGWRWHDAQWATSARRQPLCFSLCEPACCHAGGAPAPSESEEHLLLLSLAFASQVSLFQESQPAFHPEPPGKKPAPAKSPRQWLSGQEGRLAKPLAGSERGTTWLHHPAFASSRQPARGGGRGRCPAARKPGGCERARAGPPAHRCLPGASEAPGWWLEQGLKAALEAEPGSERGSQLAASPLAAAKPGSSSANRAWQRNNPSLSLLCALLFANPGSEGEAWL